MYNFKRAAVVAVILLLGLLSSTFGSAEWNRAQLKMPTPSGIVQSSWYMLGPFAHKGDFWTEQHYAPETKVDLNTSYQGLSGDIKWREMPSWSHEREKHNFFDVLDFPTDNVDCYAFRKITSPASMDAYLYYSADDSIFAWVNGKQVFSDIAQGQCFPRAKMVKVRLNKGDNELLIKVGNADQGFEFYCEVQPVISPKAEASALEDLITRFPNDANIFSARMRLMELYNSLNMANKAEEHLIALMAAKPASKYDESALLNARKFRPQGIGWPSTVSSIPGGVEVKTSKGKLLVRFVKSQLARLTFIPSGVTYPISDKFRPLPVGELAAVDNVSIDKESSSIKIASQQCSVEINNATGTITLKSPSATRQVMLTCSSDEARADVSTVPGEALFGGGEQFNGLNQRGKSISVGNSDRAWGGQYLNIPFITTSNFDAFYMNSYGGGQLDMDSPDFPDKLHMRLQERVVDLFWSVGEPKKMVGDYCYLTGYPQMPPDWAFNVWFSRNSYGNEKEVLEAATRLREEKIQSGVLVLEAWREGDDGMADEDWTKWGTKNKWPDPEGMCAKLHAMDYKVVLWTMPWYMVRPEKLWPHEKEAIDKGYFFKNPNGSTYGIDKGITWCSPSPDFTNPEANKWWDSRYMPLLDKVKGADAFKTDMGENTGGEAKNYKGWNHLSNQFTALYPKIVYEMTQKKLGEGVVFARTGGIGSQRYPILWSGDIWAFWSGIKEAVSGMLSSSVCGYSFTSSDAGGYWGDPPAKCYIRWFQLGCFQPVMQFHGQSPREPWYFGDEAIPICRYYCDLHTRLIPYIKAAGKVSCEKGIPIVRPLWMEVPGDKKAYAIQDEYFFGPDLLVAPIYAERDTRNVYLPSGKWTDWWTGKTIQGPCELSINVDLDKIPIYVKSGSSLTSLMPKDGKGIMAK